MNFLLSMSDSEFNHLVSRVLARLHHDRSLSGGTQYGVDLPTLRVVAPGWYDTYMLLRAAYNERVKDERNSSND